MSQAPMRLLDCDTHCYEPRDCFSRFIPAEYAGRTLRTVMIDGHEAILADRRVATLTFELVDQFDNAFQPGSLKEMLAQMASGNPDETYEPVPMQDIWVKREPRLELMDEQDVDKAVLFPGAMALSLEAYVEDPTVLFANLTSFNRWLDEDWGYAYEDRIFATPMLSFRDLDLAVAEAERIIDRGARFVMLPAGPVDGRSPSDPYFDPIWARLEEAGVVPSFHIGPSWELRHISPAWGLEPDLPGFRMSAWQWQNVWGDHVIEAMLSAMIFDNIFGRFPKLQVLAAEYGAGWVPRFVRHMDKSRGLGRAGPWIGGPLTERPSEIFHRHVRVTPYAEDDIPRIIDELDGRSESLVMGSDYPHAEGVATPRDYEASLEGLSADVQRGILSENAASLFDAV